MRTTALGIDRAVGMLTTMVLIRAFEEKADELFAQGRVHGTMHLSIGQEAVATGVCAALRTDDYILSTHRGHGHCLAKGAEVRLMMAEFPRGSAIVPRSRPSHMRKSGAMFPRA